MNRKRRVRRPLHGMLLHMDCSRHPWFQDDRWYDTVVITDDATSEIYYAQLVDEEIHHHGDGRALGSRPGRKGLFCCLYSDRKSFLAHA